MNRKEMQQAIDSLNTQEDVENARIVEFLGKPHVHIDYADGDIGVIGNDGETKRIPVGKNGGD